jgi:chemotaxis protein CheD
MSPNENDLPVIYLKSGELHFSDKPSSVMTVLGSCLSVTMFHRKTRVGAICHGLLPKCRERAVCSRHCAERAKYVECAIEMMVKLFDEHRMKRSEIEVKVQARMFSVRLGREQHFRGRQNIEIAQRQESGHTGDRYGCGRYDGTETVLQYRDGRSFDEAAAGGHCAADSGTDAK